MFDLSRVLQYFEGPDEDGNFTTVLDDGEVHIDALFRPSAIKQFELRYDSLKLNGQLMLLQ